MDSVFEVEGVDNALQDGDVGGVDSSGRSIFVFEGLEEADEERMED